MAENKIVKLNKGSLPIDSDTGEYVFRYRIVSEDKNRFSAWSSAYRIIAPTIDQILAANGKTSGPGPNQISQPAFSIQTSTTGVVANITWNRDSIFSSVEQYDVYVKWGTVSGGVYTYPSTEYVYLQTSSAGSFSIVRPTSRPANSAISIKIQSITYPKKLLSSQVLFTIADKAFS
jgi:hypothetical protein